MQKIFVLSANDRRIFLGLLLSGIVANQSYDCYCSILGHQTSSYGDWWRIVEFQVKRKYGEFQIR